MTAESIQSDVLTFRRAGSGEDPLCRPAIKSSYHIIRDGDVVGYVWQLSGRSFSGAWGAINHTAAGRSVSRCFTRAEAVGRVGL